MKRIWALALFTTFAEPSWSLNADFDSNGKVDFDDFFLFVNCFGQSTNNTNRHFDLNQDGTINLGDFFIFADHFGETVRSSVVEVDPEGRADGQSDDSGEVLVQSEALESDVKFLIQDSDGNPVQDIQMDYREATEAADILVAARFSDPASRFREIIYLGDPRNMEPTASKRTAKLAVTPVIVVVLIIKPVLEIVESIQEIDFILDEKALNKIRLKGEPACLDIQSTVELIRTINEGQLTAVTLGLPTDISAVVDRLKPVGCTR